MELNYHLTLSPERETSVMLKQIPDLDRYYDWLFRMNNLEYIPQVKKNKAILTSSFPNPLSSLDINDFFSDKFWLTIRKNSLR